MSNGYIFKGYRNFEMFYRVNKEKLFLETDSATIGVVKNQLELFQKAVGNTVGGCPCNASKRREQAHKVYKETVEMLAQNQEIKERVLGLLNDPDEVAFFEGQVDGNPVLARNLEPFARMKK
jgi:hypothetical protein